MLSISFLLTFLVQNFHDSKSDAVFFIYYLVQGCSDWLVLPSLYTECLTCQEEGITYAVFVC